MRPALILAVLSLSACSLIRTRNPDPPPIVQQPTCHDTYGPPIVDGLVAAGGGVVTGLGTYVAAVRPVADDGTSNIPAAVGFIAAGAVTAALFGTFAGIGVSRIGACRDAIATWDREEAERQRIAEALRAEENRRLDEEHRRAAEAERVERAEREKVDAEARARDEAQRLELQRALDALRGFQKAEWGMSERDVMQLFPGGRLSTDKAKSFVRTPREVAGLDAELVFVFDGSQKLVETRVAFADQQRGFADWRQICEAVTKALTERYGVGRTSDEVLNSYSVRWRGEATLVQLDCSALAIWPKKRVTLFYSDRAFEEARPDVKGGDL